MKIGVLLVIFTVLSSITFGQNLSGQWKGDFLDKSTSNGDWGGDKCEYVLDLECKGTSVTGYSYTYFTDEGKRYYTICRLTGFVDLAKKYIEVTEVERTKTNVPARIRNCFQVHRLSYSKLNGNENLDGSWAPAPTQDGNCGFGLTSLSRRNLKSSFPNFNSSASKAPKVTGAKLSGKTPVAKATPLKKPLVKPSAKTPPAIVKTTPKKIILKSATAKVITKTKPAETTLTPNKGNVQVQNIQITQVIPQNITVAPLNFEKRNNTLLKTLEIENSTVKVELYDNGEIDGDSISVYYNKVLLLGKKRLTDKAITLTLSVENNEQINELVMFAENLGSIPPNTALMVVTDGTKRYEVRITSDLQKSGTIRFIHKK